MRFILMAALPLALLAACASTRPVDPPQAAKVLLKPASAPDFASADPADDRDIAAAAAAFASEMAAGNRGARRVTPHETPFLLSAPEGRAFLALPASRRALALGSPPLRCPARAAAAAAPGAGDPARAAGEAALAACREQLARSAPDPAGCGCQIVAVKDALVARGSAFAYAPGVAARVISDVSEEELELVARETATGDGGRRLDFHPAPGDRLSVFIAPDGSAEAAWRGPEGDATFVGRRFADGLRRGRFAERVAATDAAGRRLLVIVGYEPVEFAVRRAELTAWPGS